MFRKINILKYSPSSYPAPLTAYLFPNYFTALDEFRIWNDFVKNTGSVFVPTAFVA